ncbi:MULTISPECIES: hypothetical protein [Pseudomonas syringae group]|uniref:Uncharacterized protein n=1 Tax=Pseudomonas syringae pv. coriandricola TaxID=264453 RepID=A0A0P9L7Y4_9PSED|nr:MULTISPECIES: hypothetical protein [Pseudomonas syringae group]KPW73799.1 Uncharacterized protein ALO76_03949 [Pseudomonas syringae pv. coriandricola]RMN09425.1 hypothetical protein ALQ65_00593 [Pseudomonas syringae pv. coriandricola]
MKLNSTENLHGIMQGFTTLTSDAADDCRTALHKGNLFCVYLGEDRQIKYIIKSPHANWGNPTALGYAHPSNSGYVLEDPSEAQEIVHVSMHPLDNHTTPSLVSFQEQLWLIFTDPYGSTEFRIWDESKASFKYKHQRALTIEHSATYAQLNNRLYMFYKLHGSKNIYCSHTPDMENWTAPEVVKKDGINTIKSNLSPVATTYQGLIHLIYKDIEGGFFLIKSDGECWTSSIALVPADYHHSPGIAVHNGLLKLAFCNLAKAKHPALYQYSFDGNALSAVVASTMLTAGGSPALSTQNGKLVAVYLEHDRAL